jgi:LuxR family transcriptional regulator, maltose regulon positive regulatory protein
MSGGRTVVARTKFGVPHVPHATIRRRALVARLDATSCPLSLVVAAPCSGKTALLTHWVEDLDEPVAWLTCDAADADPASFWTNLATSVRSAWPDIGAPPHGVAGVADLEDFAIRLANDLGALGRRCVIVVDDFHLARAEPALMKMFVDALPPGVRLVLGSRSDPSFSLSRLRLQGNLLELRQADLRFTTAEVGQLLTDLGADVDGAQVEQITEVTEGWAAAVHLAGLWLRAGGDPASLLRGLLDTDRSLVDLLVNEVIDIQSPEIVEFLTVTAELETFDAGLCDAVLGRDDGAETLRHVDAANLFLVRVDDSRGVYRYHHLFAQFLRGRLRATARERIPDIHRAAAAAYGRRGDLMSAVHHSMKAGDPGLALAQLESYITTSQSLEDQATGGDTARGWLDEHGRSHPESSPHSVLVSTIVLNGQGRGGDAEAWLRYLDAREADLEPEARFLLHAAWSFHLLQHGDPPAALARTERAADVLGENPVHSAWVDVLPNVVIQARLWLDDLDGADAAIGDLRAAIRTPVTTQVRVPGFASQVAFDRGDLVDALRLARSALAAADELGLHPRNFGRAEPHMTLAMVAIERNHLDEAEAHLDHVLPVVEDGRRPPIDLLAHLQLALIAGARGDEQGARENLRRARALLPQAADPVIARIDEVDLRLALDRRDHTTADALQQRLPSSARSGLLAARVRLAVGDHSGARDILEAADGHCSTRRLRVEHGLLSAMAIAETEPRRAHEILHDALARAEPVGFHRTVVAQGPALWKLLESLPADGAIADYIAHLLDAAHHVVAPAGTGGQDGLVDALSDRELTVLRYLSSQLSSTEIAQELYVSVNTVRSHVKAIYRKLGVNSRRDAVERGRAVLATTATWRGRGAAATPLVQVPGRAAGVG